MLSEEQVAAILSVVVFLTGGYSKSVVFEIFTGLMVLRIVSPSRQRTGKCYVSQLVIVAAIFISTEV